MSKTKWHGNIIHLVVALLVVAMVLVLGFSPAPMLAFPEVTYRSVGSSPGANSADCVITKPTGLVVGDLMIAQVLGIKATSGADIGTFTAPAGWTSIRQDNRRVSGTGVAYMASALFWKIADASDIAASTFTFTATGATSNRGAITVWYGHNRINPINANNGTTSSTSTTITAPSISPSVADCKILFFCGIYNDLGISNYAVASGDPSSWSEAYDLPSDLTYDLNLAVGYGTRSATGATGTATATIASPGTYNIGQLVAIAPNQAPLADSQSGLTIDSCSTLTVTLTGSDPENDPLTYIISALPLYGDLYDGTGTGGTKITSVNYTVTDLTHNVTYKPSIHYTMADIFGFKVNDGEFDSDEATISLTINGCDDQDYYDGWEYYCVGNEVWMHRMFHDFSCVGGACVEVDSYYTDETFVEDCDDQDYTTDWVYYCDGDSIWRTRDLHDFYCLNGTCQEDVTPVSEWVEDCPTDYYTDWVYYCDGDSVWHTRDHHDFYCLNGTCQEDIIPESEWVQDCPTDYYTDWVYYCDGDSIWRTCDLHDFYCLNGTCQEDVTPDSEWVEDCPTDYYTDWVYYCDGDSVWRTRDLHDFYCLNGTCQEDVTPDSEWVEDCPTDYYTDWVYYCDGDSVWRTRDLHDFYCFKGICQEEVTPVSEWVQDCPTDYYTDWVYYCDGDSVWHTRDHHDFYCLNGICQEDIIPESEWVQDCPTDYYTDWVYYCDGDSVWRTRDLHDFYCLNGTCYENVIPQSEWYADCPTDYYTDWVYYCDGDSVWRTRDLHDFYCLNGTCQEDVTPESAWVEDCPTDYYTDWVYYCDGDSVWRTRDHHDYYCFNGTCSENVTPESEWVEDCDDGDPCTIDTCVNGTCVHIWAGPTATALSNSPVSQGATIELYGGPDGMTSYNWTGPGGWTSDLQNPTRPNATTAMAGTYNLTVTNSNGCTDDDTTNVVVEVPPPEDPTVTTQAATGVSISSANLNMAYTVGDFNPVDVCFAYKKSTDSVWSYTGWVSQSADGTYSASLTGLSSNTKYDFKAQLKYNDTVIEGTTLQFTTAKSSLPASQGCFIATAAYGTPTAEQIDVLREFRDVVLLKSTVGSQFVALYYQFSPPVADFIASNELLRTLVRELLIDPIVWIVEATGDAWRN